MNTQNQIEEQVNELLDSNEIILDNPIMRGDTAITKLTIVPPRIEVMRKYSMLDLIRMEISTILNILPFITKERLQKHEVDQLSTPDLLEVGIKVAGFFQKKAG